MTDVITSRIPSATLLTDVGTELTFQVLLGLVSGLVLKLKD
jgi:hypothetical protein